MTSYVSFQVLCKMKETRNVIKQTIPTAMYVQLRKGFFPPVHEVVLIRNCFRPEKLVTG